VIPLYRAGASVLHRSPTGAKLIVLAVVAVVCSLYPHTALTALIVLGLTLGVFLIGGLGPVAWLLQLWQAKWIIAFLAVSQAVFLGPVAALTGTVRVVSVLLLAAAVTMTTRTSDMIDAIERALRPFRRIGADPARVAFTASLTIAVIPVIGALAAQIREAQRARGVRLGVRWIAVLLVNALRHADDVGDALTARGIV